MREMRHLLLVAVAALSTWIPVQADVRLPALIGDNMVLQQGQKARIWGWADPGEQVTVTLGSIKADATADTNGKWKTTIGPLKPGGPVELTIAGKNRIALKNVLIGEVWVCSGQSNMAFSVKNGANADDEIAKAGHPQIRLLTVPRVVSDKPVEDVEAEWVVCSPETVASFSAAAYYFGRDLHKALGVPIGLIHSSWGGTPAEAWTTRATLKADPILNPILDQWDELITQWPKKKEQYDGRMEEWKKARDEAKTQGKNPPRAPMQPRGPNHPHMPAGLSNAMIAPLTPCTIRGVIWYQGEGNAKRAYQYRKLFPAMIQDWRKAWGLGDFPFLFVQLANFKERKAEPADSEWAELREAQLMTLSLPKTGMAVIIDIGEADNIHPKNKQDVGRRLSLAAQTVAYGRAVVSSGPIYESMAVEADHVRLRFKHVGGGLVAQGSDRLIGFAIAGADHRFVWADARIDGNTVVVRSSQVAQPAAVRYAWADNPECNLYNREGLPATPFRTDDWPGVTIDAR